MRYEHSSSAYQQTEVMSSSPARLVPVLYEHLLVGLKRATMQMKKGDIEGKFESLARASDIVSELLASLDFDQGGELATRLAALYGFWLNEMSVAGRTLDTNRLQRVADMVASLLEAWRQVASAVETGEAESGLGTAT
jgi:flagellar protein FliS